MENKIQKNIFKNFSNKNRVKLMLCLSKPQSVNELLTRCDLSQSSLSQHLKILKDGGVAECKRDGKKQIYKIKDKKVLTVAKLLIELSH